MIFNKQNIIILQTKNKTLESTLIELEKEHSKVIEGYQSTIVQLENTINQNKKQENTKLTECNTKLQQCQKKHNSKHMDKRLTTRTKEVSEEKDTKQNEIKLLRTQMVQLVTQADEEKDDVTRRV